VLLIPELLTKPIRDGVESEIEALAVLLGRLDLRPVDEVGCRYCRLAWVSPLVGRTHPEQGVWAAKRM